jgi:hypothetical protein
LLSEPLIGTLFIGKDNLKPINVLTHQEYLFAINANIMNSSHNDKRQFSAYHSIRRSYDVKRHPDPGVAAERRMEPGSPGARKKSVANTEIISKLKAHISAFQPLVRYRVLFNHLLELPKSASPPCWEPVERDSVLLLL